MKKVRFIKLQFLDAFPYVFQRSMAQFFSWGALSNERRPTKAKLLDGAHVNYSVVEILIQFWHVVFDKCFVHSATIA
jgi:hypothetical protein